MALGVAALMGLAATARLCAQAPSVASTPASAPAEAQSTTPSESPSSPVQLSRYAPGENLILYVEFAGLESHSEAWRKTAAFKMLTTTSLGEMLEEVSAQLLERILSEIPGHKVSGAELVSLCKSASRNGWALAVNGGEQGSNPFVGTLVLRGGASKENRPVTSRLIGTMMGPEPKTKIERKSDRVTVVVPGASSPESGWVWWPEKNDDVVIGFMQPSNADAILAALTGKKPSAADSKVLNQLTKADGTFQPVLTAMVDPTAAASVSKTKLGELLEQLKKSVGLTRLDYRWGFDGDALLSVARLVAPAPRRPMLAIFDQPKLDPKQLIPVPEGVDSFVQLSASPAKIIATLTQPGSSGSLKSTIEELYDQVKAQSRIDVEKDLLGNLGPRLAVYLAPGRSAAATDEPPPTPAASTDPMAILSTLQGALPKPTLVAEVQDPVAFGKALDAVMIAANKELKARAIEKAAEEPADTDRDQGQGRGQGRGERSSRKKSSRETPAPEFRLMPGNAKLYMMSVPSDSPLKPLPPGVHPSIRLEGKYVAIASSSDAARAALEAARRKDWRAPADIEQAIAHVANDPVLLAVMDPRETMPSVLASLPGTLQAAINTIIARSAPGANPAGNGVAPGAAQPAGPGLAGDPRGIGRRGNEEGGRRQGGFPGASGGGPPPGYAGLAGRPGFGGGSGPPPGSGGNAAAQEAMIQIKVDPAKLPKAEELKALMFPATLTVAVDAESVRFINREAFPNLVNSAGLGGVGAALLVPAVQAARTRAREAAAANAAAAAAAAATQPAQPGPGAFPGAGGPPGGGRPPGQGGVPKGGGRPGGRGGRTDLED